MSSETVRLGRTCATPAVWECLAEWVEAEASVVEAAVEAEASAVVAASAAEVASAAEEAVASAAVDLRSANPVPTEVEHLQNQFPVHPSFVQSPHFIG